MQLLSAAQPGPRGGPWLVCASSGWWWGGDYHSAWVREHWRCVVQPRLAGCEIGVDIQR